MFSSWRPVVYQLIGSIILWSELCGGCHSAVWLMPLGKSDELDICTRQQMFLTLWWSGVNIVLMKDWKYF